MIKPTSGTPIALRTIHGSQERFLLLAEEGNHAVARDGHGHYQALTRDASAPGGWKCVKVATSDWDRAVAWAREADISDVMPHEVAEIAITAYEAKGYLVRRVGSSLPGGRFATYHIQTPNGLQVFTIRVEEE